MTQDIMKYRYTDGKPNLRRFHQARWDEPVIFELSQPGQRGVLLPEAENEVKDIVGMSCRRSLKQCGESNLLRCLRYHRLRYCATIYAFRKKILGQTSMWILDKAPAP